MGTHLPLQLQVKQLTVKTVNHCPPGIKERNNKRKKVKSSFLLFSLRV